jgi:hypothetical protein
MSEHNTMDHEEGTPSDEGSGNANGLHGFVRSRYFSLVVTGAVLLVGFLLARRFGIGGRLLPIVGLGAFMMVGHSFMHRGHGSHGGQGSHGGHGSHGGCGSSSHERLESRPVQTSSDASRSPAGDEVDQQDSHRGHSGCH